MPFSFPSSPTVGQTSTQNGRQYVWNPPAWELVASSGGSLPSTITGSLAVTGDDSYGSVSLLLSGDDLIDRSSPAKTVTAYGSAAATGTARFGTNSLSFSGSSSYLLVPGNSAFSLPGDFTIESWVRLGTPSAFSGLYGAAIVSIYAGIAGNPGWQLRINGTSSGYDTLNFYTGATDLNWSYSFALDTWYHVALTRSGSTLRAWVNGSQVGSTVTNSENMTPAVNNDLYVGRLNLGGYEFQLNGLIDDLRITKGVARTISTPSAALPAFASYTLSNVTLSVSNA